MTGETIPETRVCSFIYTSVVNETFLMNVYFKMTIILLYDFITLSDQLKTIAGISHPLLIFLSLLAVTPEDAVCSVKFCFIIQTL